MNKGAQIYEGPGRRVFRTDDPNLLIYEFLDGAVTYDGEEAAAAPSKPERRLKISAILFNLLESNGLITHFAGVSGAREMKISATKHFPVVTICRNVAAGRFAERLGVPEGETLPMPVVEFNLDKHPLRTHPAGEVITELSEGDVKIMQSKAITANKILKRFFRDKGLTLSDFGVEFGRDSDGRTRICGALTPDTCRLWRSDEFEKIDRDRFRRALRGTEADYIDVLNRISPG
ncbi:MAG: phosphoribosylaminoimidazolesuccinocarboxamide synthase [bacterium]